MSELDVKEWMKKADEDLDSAEYLLKGGKLSAAAFFTQQAAEKALKAIYINKFGKIWKIHNLVELGKAIGATYDILELCSDLTPSYVATRYPGLNEKYKKEEIEELIRYAKTVIKWSKENLQQ